VNRSGFASSGNPNRLCIRELANSRRRRVSRPKPERFTPPNGKRGSETTIALMKTIPVSRGRREELLFLGIIRPRAGCKTERTVVCHLDRLAALLTRKIDATGPKTSRGRQAIPWHIDKDRRFIKESGAMNPISAGQ
jgi:hypothetical protein